MRRRLVVAPFFKSASVTAALMACPLLAQAASVQTVFSAENALYGAGYSIGQADGWIDDSLRAAVRQYQAERPGLSATGELDSPTLAALGISGSRSQLMGGNVVADQEAARKELGLTLASAPKPAPAPEPEQPAATPEPVAEPEPAVFSVAKVSKPIAKPEPQKAPEPPRKPHRSPLRSQSPNRWRRPARNQHRPKHNQNLSRLPSRSKSRLLSGPVQSINPLPHLKSKKRRKKWLMSRVLVMLKNQRRPLPGTGCRRKGSGNGQFRSTKRITTDG